MLRRAYGHRNGHQSHMAWCGLRQDAPTAPPIPADPTSGIPAMKTAISLMKALAHQGSGKKCGGPQSPALVAPAI